MQVFSKKTISSAKQIAVGSIEVTHAYVETLDGTHLVVMVGGEDGFDVMIQRDGKQFTARVRRGGSGSRDWKNIMRPVGRGGEWAVKTHFRSIREAVEHAVSNPHFSG